MVESAPFRWRNTSGVQRRTLLAAGLGWMLDAFDVMLYSIVLATLLREFGMAIGFRHVESGPLVRSSYHAWEQVQAMTTSKAD